MDIYLDLVIVLNLLVDFLLLLGTNRLSGFPAGAPRCMAASVCGGVYGGACLLPGFRFLSNLLWRTVFLGVIGMVAFGCTMSSLRRTCLFVILSMAMGGIALSMEKGNFLYLLGAGGAVWLLCTLAFRESIGSKKYAALTLFYKGKSVSTIALRDSGNCLRDPITGDPVYLIGWELAQKLTGLSLSQINSPYETLMAKPISGLRLIPFRAVGNDCGVILGIRLDQVVLDGRNRKAVVAFASEGLGSGGEYQALVCTD